MRLNKENVIYLLAFVPGLLGLILQMLIGQYFHIVIRILLAAILLYILWRGIVHFSQIPRAREKYDDLEEQIDFPIPDPLREKQDIRVYLSSTLDRLENNQATTQVLASLRQPVNAPTELIASRKLADQHPTMLPIIAARELIKSKNNTRAWNFFRIIFPFLLLFNFLLLFYFSDIRLFAQAPTFLRSLLMPTLIAALAIVFMVTWSKHLLRSEQKIDRVLLDYYPAKDLKTSIALEELIEGKGEKERFQQVNSADVRQRMDAIDKFAN